VRTERRLLGLVLPHKRLLAAGLVANGLASVLDGATFVILIPLLKHLFGTAGPLQVGSGALQSIVDWLTGPFLANTSSAGGTARLVLLLVGTLALKNVMGYAATQMTVAIQEGLVRDLRASLFRHLLRLDLGFFQRTRGGQLISSMVSEVDNTKSVVTASLASLFRNAVLVAATLFVLSQISWRLTLLTLAVVPLLLVGVQSLLKRLRRHARARTQERAEVTSTVAERLGAIRLIRSYGATDIEGDRFDRLVTSYRKKVIRTQRFSSLTGPVSEIFGGIVMVLIIWAGTRPQIIGLSEPLAPEVLIVFLLAALRMTSPLKALTQFPTAMSLAVASAERVFELLDTPATEVDQPGERPVGGFTESIVFDQVSFAYGDDAPVLRDVSLTVPKGTVLAIVGPSGAGKSTLADLLPRFHEPTAGEIRLDGMPISRFTRGSLRDLMAVVSQDAVLLNDTVAANIAYGRPQTPAAQIEAAARAANAHDFIAALPNGYETVLGERGTRLSGGQRQRVAIARALLRDAPILILDEATSALDTESERLVQEAIDRLMADRTVLVIAHRLSTVRDADQIAVLEGGRVAELGTHATLYHASGLYRRLYDLQFRDSALAAAEMEG
jgi:ATP-binding cassette, subfamily B, bacterial MsbA